MKKKKEDKNRMEKLVTELELIGLQIGEELDEIESQYQDDKSLEEMKNQIRNDKVGLALHYFELAQEEKEDFQKRLKKVFETEEEVENIIQELVNLYFLKTEGLLELEEIAPQKEVSYEALENLFQKIEAYLKGNTHKALEEKIKELSERFEKVVELGTLLEEEEDFLLEDIDFLEWLLERVNLTDEEEIFYLDDYCKSAIYYARFYVHSVVLLSRGYDTVNEFFDVDYNIDYSQELQPQVVEKAAKILIKALDDYYFEVLEFINNGTLRSENFSYLVRFILGDCVESWEEEEIDAEELFLLFFQEKAYGFAKFMATYIAISNGEELRVKGNANKSTEEKVWDWLFNRGN